MVRKILLWCTLLFALLCFYFVLLRNIVRLYTSNGTIKCASLKYAKMQTGFVATVISIEHSCQKNWARIRQRPRTLFVFLINTYPRMKERLQKSASHNQLYSISLNRHHFQIDRAGDEGRKLDKLSKVIALSAKSLGEIGRCLPGSAISIWTLGLEREALSQAAAVCGVCFERLSPFAIYKTMCHFWRLEVTALFHLTY